MDAGYFFCPCCGGIFTYLRPPCRPPVCCSQKAQRLAANTCGDPLVHLPVVTCQDGMVTVHVGQEPHPMTPEHLIQWIGLQTSCGAQYRFLKPGDAPSAQFALAPGERAEAALAYCNLHGLWRTEL